MLNRLKKIEPEFFFLFVLLGSVFGYFFTVSIATIIDANNAILSLSLRSLILLFSIVGCLFFSATAVANRNINYAILLLFCFYFARLIYVTFFDAEGLGRPISEYWIWFVGSTFMPMIYMLYAKNVCPIDNVFKKLFLFFLTVCIIVAFFSSPTVVDNRQLVNTCRLQLPALNPISLCLLGSSLLIIATHVLNFDRFGNALLAFSYFIGTYLLVWGNSRGPLIGYFICALFVIYLSDRRLTIRTFIALTCVSIGILVKKLFSYCPTPDRFVNLATDASVTTRLDTFQRAISPIGDQSHPLYYILFGSGLEDPVTHYYPHNILIESFLATGIFGFALLTTIIFFAFYKIRLSYISNPTVLYVIFVQYFIDSLLSGSVIFSSPFWVLLAASFNFAYQQPEIPRTS